MRCGEVSDGHARAEAGAAETPAALLALPRGQEPSKFYLTFGPGLISMVVSVKRGAYAQAWDKRAGVAQRKSTSLPC